MAADGERGLRPHPFGGVLREQRRRRRRGSRRAVRKQGRGGGSDCRRPEVQGSADQHAGGRCPQRCPGRGGEGSTKKADLALGGALFGGGAGGAIGGYGNTNEGKIIAAAFMDNYNGIVRTVRNDPSLQRSVGTLKAEAAAGGSTKVGGGFNEGDVIVTKIANVRLLAQPTETAAAHHARPR